LDRLLRQIIVGGSGDCDNSTFRGGVGNAGRLTTSMAIRHPRISRAALTPQIPSEMETPAQPKKANPLILVIGLAVGIMAGTVGVRTLFKPQSIEQALESTASEMNKRAPMMADKETRLDKTTTAPNKTLVYHYTLINLRAADVQKDLFVKQLRPNIIANYKSHPDMKTLREKGVTLAYEYSDKAGVPIARFEVSPKDF
jgi:hypothetical protein